MSEKQPDKIVGSEKEKSAGQGFAGISNRLKAVGKKIKSAVGGSDSDGQAKSPAAVSARPDAPVRDRPLILEEEVQPAQQGAQDVSAGPAEQAGQALLPAGGMPVESDGAEKPAQAPVPPSKSPQKQEKDGAADGRTRVNAIAPKKAKGTPQTHGPRRRIKRKAPVSTFIFTVIGNVMKAAFVVCCIGLMAGSVAAVQVVQYVVAETQNDDNILDIENIKLNQTSYIMALDKSKPNADRSDDEDYVVYQELIGEENRVWVTLDHIPQHLIDAVVAIEDREFYNHHGVAFERTAYALANELFQFQDTSFGASTIDQQLVKNITGDDVVSDDGGDMLVGYQRKLREMFRAWGLNNRYSKDMIMEAYLNTMSLSERIAGVQAGAIEYFGKDVSDLNIAECATIAGVTRSPGRYSPFNHPEASRERRDDVLYQMYQEGFITQQEYVEALDQPLGVQKQQRQPGEESALEVFSYFSDAVFNDVVNDFMEQKGWSKDEAVKNLYNGGYRIYSTMDTDVQKSAEDIYLTGYDENGFFLDPNRFPGYERAMTVVEEETRTLPDGSEQVIGTHEVLPQSACAVINYDGELVAVVGGIGPKESSLSLNRAIGTLRRDPATGQLVKDANGNYIVDGTLRQVGSTMKMTAAYPLGLDNRLITYSTGVLDSGVFPKDPNNPGLLDWPKNYSNTYRNQPLPIMSAIAESTNTVAVQVGEWVGRQEMYDFLTDTLQVSSLLDPEDVAPAPLVLGSMTYGMCAYELAGCYMMYGGNDTYGVFNSLHSYTKVVDSKGNIVLEPERTTVQAIDPQTGYVGNRLLSNVLRASGLPGGATGTAIGMPVAGEMDSVAKTGTTSDDNDRWLVGLTPYYVTAVWWGYDEEHTLYGRWGPGAYNNIPVNVWKALMEDVQADLPVKEFPAVPEGVQQMAFCTVSGMRASAGCPAMMGYYQDFNIPDFCPGHAPPEEEDPAADPAAAPPV